MSRNLVLRIIVAAIFCPAIIYIGYLGGYALKGMLLLFAIIGMGEYLWNIKLKPSSPLYWLAILFTVGTAAATMEIGFSAGFILLSGFFVCAGMYLAVKNESPEKLFNGCAVLFWGVAYIGLLYPYVYYVRSLSIESGGHWLLFLFGTLWLSDTLAMGVGKNLGKHKLAPTVSPNKTVEGFFGGIFGGIIVALIMKLWLLPEISPVFLVIAGLIVSIVGQLGDLVESMWKRSHGVKDSSAIIPGHGGVLDRFDSLLFAAPALYWFLKYVVYG